ncbi:DUF871 domain-containing protein [Peribacillus deserti]|uniref:DUF871 domain-containing protein n=1 Tax=Peribacillus deserti TaxID=673318 RepID=A0A2N5M6W3_9BACI|nr:MupG family TIM beta-alpha barrel fold protein [Peribacillus deserti]PLT30075.1 DUF871 domain-containing protein [Peribacillus deserti]
MLGISVYLGHMEDGEQREYLEMMKEAGFTSIFTSLHIPEDNPAAFRDLLAVLGGQARELGMELMADVSPKSFKHLGVTMDTLKEIVDWGVSGLRIDYGIEAEVIARLSHDMKIALNASTIDDELYLQLKGFGLKEDNIEAWHNYYPRPETGLDREGFIKQNKWLETLGFTVMAFIPGDETLRGPMFKGLPTLEDHRGMSPFTAYLDLLHQCHVSKVLIGDKSLKRETLRKFTQYKEGAIELSISLCKDISEWERKIVRLRHNNRMDAARDVIRSEPSRIFTAEKGITIPASGPHERKTGYITIDNKDYGRYQGELQIVKRTLRADPKVNAVGAIVDKDIELIRYLYPGKTFTFKEIE